MRPGTASRRRRRLPISRTRWAEAPSRPSRASRKGGRVMKNAKPLTATVGLVVLCSAFAAPAAVAQTGGATRMEHDLLGDKAVPADAYYGVQTARALENFQISGVNTNHYPGYWEA